MVAGRAVQLVQRQDNELHTVVKSIAQTEPVWLPRLLSVIRGGSLFAFVLDYPGQVKRINAMCTDSQGDVGSRLINIPVRADGWLCWCFSRP